MSGTGINQEYRSLFDKACKLQARGEDDEALEIFFSLESREISPKSERTSLALFHALLDCGRDDEAFDEMRRFLSVSESVEYQRLLNEINEV